MKWLVKPLPDTRRQEVECSGDAFDFVCEQTKAGHFRISGMKCGPGNAAWKLSLWWERGREAERVEFDRLLATKRMEVSV